MNFPFSTFWKVFPKHYSNLYAIFLDLWFFSERFIDAIAFITCHILRMVWTKYYCFQLINYDRTFNYEAVVPRLFTLSIISSMGSSPLGVLFWELVSHYFLINSNSSARAYFLFTCTLLVKFWLCLVLIPSLSTGSDFKLILWFSNECVTTTKV